MQHLEIAFFRFRPVAGISLSAQGRPRPKWTQKPAFRDFLPLGVRWAKTQIVKQLWKTIPDSVGVLFPVSGPLLFWGPPGALRG